MRKILNIIPALFLFLVACNNAEEAKTHDEHAGHQKTELATDANEAESHEGEAVAVQLDNGKKWEANAETTEGIKRMQAIIETGTIAKATPATLYDPLQKEFQTIFEKCTMKGEAHNQLHNYLVPVKDYLKALKDESTGAKALTDLASYLTTYQNYFV